MSRRARLTGVVLAAAVVAGACGGGGDSGSTAAQDTAPAAEDTAPAAEDTAPAAPATGEGAALPAVMVQDVAGGGPVSIRDAVTLAKPTLVWFWAPH
ncbi:MAG: hypothetical protein ACRDZ7_12080 [Acidimicrobiia bacterium]